jgi:DNA primase
MRENEGVEAQTRIAELPSFNTVPLPDDAIKITDITDFDKYSMAVLEYMALRNLNTDDTNYYWSPSLGYRDRLIIPFYYDGRIVGWTGRSVNPDKKPKYLTEVQPGYVYGLDEQSYNKVFAIVVEGQIDAIHIDGCALGGSEISDQQVMLLNKLQKQIIVVPDRDKAGSKLVERAIELGWSVAMPDWDSDITDVGDAVDKYGRLYTLYSIANTAEESAIKIRLRAKKWFT